LPWLAAALNRNLGIPDLTDVWDAAPVGAATGDPAVDLSVDAATAARGGRIPVTLRREDGSEQRVEVVLPAGTQNGRRLRLKGLGVGGKDLYIRVEIRELA
jgi:DnaJ-class molecular chaperone